MTGHEETAGSMGSAAPREYAARLTADLAAAAGLALEAAYLHGSAAFGGWVAERSDVDVLVVVADEVAEPVVAAIADVVTGSQGCPGRGLECSVVTAGSAAQPAPPWPFVLHAGSGHFGQGPTMVRGDAQAGDPDLLMHYAACRAAGIVLAGPPPVEVIGPVARPEILRYLAGDLAWGLDNASEGYAVLNACRALVFLDEDRLVSKVTGGLAALERGVGPAGLIRRALDQQRARVPERPAAADAVAFVRQVAGRLTAAAGDGRPGGLRQAAPPRRH